MWSRIIVDVYGWPANEWNGIENEMPANLKRWMDLKKNKKEKK